MAGLQVDATLVNGIFRVQGDELLVIAYLTRYVVGDPSGPVGYVGLLAEDDDLCIGEFPLDHTGRAHAGGYGTDDDNGFHDSASLPDHSHQKTRCGTSTFNIMHRTGIYPRTRLRSDDHHRPPCIEDHVPGERSEDKLFHAGTLLGADDDLIHAVIPRNLATGMAPFASSVPS